MTMKRLKNDESFSHLHCSSPLLERLFLLLAQSFVVRLHVGESAIEKPCITDLHSHSDTFFEWLDQDALQYSMSEQHLH